MTIDIDELRNDLIDYFGTAMSSGMSVAIIDLSKVENASPEELVKIAIANGFDISKYQVNDRDER